MRLPRLRFRFGFRTLLLLVALVAVSLALVANPIIRRRKAMDAVRSVGGQYSFKHWDDRATTIPSGTELDSLEPPGPRWLPSAVRVYLLSDVTSLHFQSWPGAPDEFSEGRFSGIDLASLKPEEIEISDLPITDAALDRIAEIDGLESLVIANGKITDAGVAEIAKLPRLKRLWLMNVPVTDGCVAHLKGMKSLENLVLPASVSDQAVEELRKALPGLKNFHR